MSKQAQRKQPEPDPRCPRCLGKGYHTVKDWPVVCQCVAKNMPPPKRGKR